ncbi:stalk domain-containing protein [Paenibacillus sp.]|uniref:stalk domain-containing protein n=1 Tax=Paenibacillus sp. TaxID=58172 RepID=UPI002D6AD396|nr:stalk domain-containing protein [Paenibacillus sp.]HZG87970.1 stalk domain-containing protein [Paenibacillus sp.]
MRKRILLIALVFSVWMGSAGFASDASAGTVTRVWLYVNKPQAFVNGKSMMLSSPANVYNGKMYVPVKFLGDTFGFPVNYLAATNTIELTAGKTNVSIDLTTRKTVVDGRPGTLQPTFEISKDGRLMAQLTWIMDRIGAAYAYDPVLNRVEVTYTQWNPELPTSQNSKPVAKFTFGKPSYKMGEKVEYIDLSYDAEGDGIQWVTWKGNREAFYTPGKHQVSLQVTDSKGNVSDVYTRTITIENATLYSPLEFQMRYAKLQSFVSLASADVKRFTEASRMPFAASQDRSRKLLVSDSPENIVEYGSLFRDTVNGKARLYANHINAMNADVQFAIVATNNGREPVTIKTTRQGEVYPSTFINLIGYQASVDFLDGDVKKPDLTVNPGESKAYVYLPKLAKGQGINLIYDVETSGNVTFTFAAMIPNDPMEAAISYRDLPYSGHVRGTFPASGIRMEADASSVTKATGPRKITIGDNVNDPFVMGFDPIRGQTVDNYGNYGVLYNLRVKQPGKAAIVMVARGGIFKGALKIDGKMILAPASGVITALDGVYMLHRTEGSEPYIDIEITPPAGSYFPIDLVWYPLE